MKFDKKLFDNRCHEIYNDIKEKKISSTSWIWITIGAAAGLLASCIKVKSKVCKPIIGNLKGGSFGKFNCKRGMSSH